ncbi:uncharacterized protein STEHIDRAFT_111899 [Stereum hirsutum FP-91666 SS1]|uniref:uncharacterized protein n=1 Tax=Stereum hirsutum (strain FP-91666) TaxID=721885 RepID=UPI000444949B|nr:uncharacterized protein STEHIDRAFT_111899 [Stereum hirsutum FP-91666 SS1]EIM85294.1 hypothetical protein STEHIDRAFT_111899 [Stereum hirsutum FP-91666 SS1]
MALITQRRTTSAESPSMDWLDALISTVGVVSTLTEAPLPWVSAATEVVLTLLKRIKSSLQNAEDLKDLACSIVDFVVLFRDSTIQHTGVSSDSSRENPFKQTCIEFTNTLTTILNELNTMKNRDKNWLKKYLKAESIGRKIARHKDSLRHIQDQLTTRAAVETGFYLPLIKDDLSSHRVEFREHFQELKSHIVGDYYRGQFRILKRGDLHLIQQHAVNREYVVEIQTTGLVSTQKLTKRQRRHRRFYGDFHVNLKESVECIVSVANVFEGRDKRVVRQYRGPESAAAHETQRFEQDLDFYEKTMHPNIAQVFAVLPDVHSIVFHDDTTVHLQDYLKNIPSSVDRFITEFRISLEEYFKTKPYSVVNTYHYLVERYDCLGFHSGQVSLAFGGSGISRVVDASYRKFIVGGLHRYPLDRIPIIENSDLFNKKMSTHVRPLSLLPMLYAAIEVVKDLAWERSHYIHLGAKPYETPLPGWGCIYTAIPNGVKKIAQLPLCHGPDINSRQRIRFRWYGGRMTRIRGWTRCEVLSPKEFSLIAHPVREPKTRADIILSQIHRLALLTGAHEDDLQYADHISFSLQYRRKRPRSDTTRLVGLAGTFMSENHDPMDGRTKERAYVFIRDVEINIYDDTSLLTTPELYWASDPEGVVRWTEEELTEYLAAWDLQTSDLILKAWYRSYCWDKEDLDALREAHQLCGLDPDSDEIAKALGHPILEVKPTFIPEDILAPRPDSEENEDVYRKNSGSNVETRPGTQNLQSSIVEVDDTEIIPVPMNRIASGNSSSQSPCASDNTSGAMMPEDQCTVLENAREPVESKQGADSSNHPIAEVLEANRYYKEVCEQNTATSNKASTAQDRLESCPPSDDVILDDPEVTQSEIGPLESSSPSVSSTEECPPPVASMEEVSASKTYGATEQICQSEIQASACRKLLKKLFLIFSPIFILGVLIGIIFTLAYHSPYLVIPKISVHVEF